MNQTGMCQNAKKCPMRHRSVMQDPCTCTRSPQTSWFSGVTWPNPQPEPAWLGKKEVLSAASWGPNAPSSVSSRDGACSVTQTVDNRQKCPLGRGILGQSLCLLSHPCPALSMAPSSMQEEIQVSLCLRICREVLLSPSGTGGLTLVSDSRFFFNRLPILPAWLQ